MYYIDEEKRPEALSATNFMLAVAVHLLFFAALWFAGQMAFREREVVIPMELTVVPVENLDGEESKPPPLKEPEPPRPPEPTPPEPAPAPVPEPRPQDAVEQVPEKPKPPEPPKPPKEPDPPKPPEPTPDEKRQDRQKRLEEMRNSAKDLKTPPKPPTRQDNGRTGRKTLSDKEIERLMNMGARPGAVENVTANEESVCLGALKRAIDVRWREVAPQIGKPGEVHLSIRFDSSRRVASCKLAKSSGDAATDAAAMKVVGGLGVVSGITKAFAEKYGNSPITIRYRIEGYR